LDDHLSRFFPSFIGQGKDEVRIRHLLTHTSGLQPWLPLELEEGTRPARIERILTAPLLQSPGTNVVYSDLGFILLAALVETVSGLRIDTYAQAHIFAPLGLRTAGYNPPPALQATCAATEYRANLGRHQVGEVHDERATCLDGVAGHAGLFATAIEVAAYGNMWLQGGRVGDTQVLSPATVAMATQVQTPPTADGRGIGWIVLRQGDTLMSCGDLFTPGSFGHTGFTGTSLWVDPSRRLVVSLMTNRVHFGRQDHILRLRPRFHNAIAAAVR
jgi:CubicO group peptidase (beta-lactamase class C family)